MEAIPTVFLKDPVFKELGEVARLGALNEKDRYAYDASLKVYRDGYAIAKTAQEDGRVEGRAEEQLKITRNLIQLGLPDETISKATGLTMAQVAAMR